MLALSGARLPSREVALKMLEVIARTMKATLEGADKARTMKVILEEAEKDTEPSDKTLRILEQLQRMINR